MADIGTVQEVHGAKQVVDDCECVVDGEGVGLDYLKYIAEVLRVIIHDDEDIFKSWLIMFVLLHGHNDIYQLWSEQIMIH